MTIKFYLLLGLISIFVLISCADVTPTNLPQSVSVPSDTTGDTGSVTMLNENGNRVLLETDNNNAALIQIFSEQGRGNADINIPNTAYPNQITLRLHLQGLEELNISHDGGAQMVAISSMGDNVIRQSATDATGERGIAEDTAEWLAVELVSTQAQSASSQPTIPLENGYIDVMLPHSFSEQKIRNFSIRWIDFYR